MSEIPRIENAVDKTRLSIREYGQGQLKSPCIFYDDVPLWRTVAYLDELDIFLYDADGEEGEPYSLFCQDSYGDIYTYGAWETKEEALLWLKEPTSLY